MFRSAWPVSSSLPLLEMQAALCLSRSQREGAETAGGDYKPAAVEHCVNDNSSVFRLRSPTTLPGPGLPRDAAGNNSASTAPRREYWKQIRQSKQSSRNGRALICLVLPPDVARTRIVAIRVNRGSFIRDRSRVAPASSGVTCPDCALGNCGSGLSRWITGVANSSCDRKSNNK